jgi:hypothetical protein
MMGVLRSQVTSERSCCLYWCALAPRAPVACAIATSLSSAASSGSAIAPSGASYACGSTRSMGMPRSGSASSSYLCVASVVESYR